MLQEFDWIICEIICSRQREKRAIQVALDMQRAIQQIANFWIRENVSTRIGIWAGGMMVGNIGSPQDLDDTAICDRVNIALRF